MLMSLEFKKYSWLRVYYQKRVRILSRYSRLLFDCSVNRIQDQDTSQSKKNRAQQGTPLKATCRVNYLT